MWYFIFYLLSIAGQQLEYHIKCKPGNARNARSGTGITKTGGALSPFPPLLFKVAG